MRRFDICAQTWRADRSRTGDWSARGTIDFVVENGQWFADPNRSSRRSRTRNDVQDADEIGLFDLGAKARSARESTGRARSVLVATSPRRCDQPTAADRPGTRQNQRPLDDPRHHVKPRAGIRDHTSAAEQYHHQPTRQDCLLDGSPGIAPRTGGRIGQTGPRWRDDLDLIDTHPPAG